MKRAYALLLSITLLLAAPASAVAATVLVVGDSLSAAFGMPQQAGWVALLQQRLHPGHTVINASISGETTAGGAARLEPLLQRHRPNIVIIELGANDGLRGLPIREMKKNLEQMVRQCQKMNARVVLVGVRLPPNYGPAYTRAFEQSYGELATEYKVALVPFIFAGLEDSPRHFQADNLHPTAAAQPVLLNNVWQGLAPLLGME
jgi:acyl-CoA thioesterase-1